MEIQNSNVYMSKGEDEYTIWTTLNKEFLILLDKELFFEKFKPNKIYIVNIHLVKNELNNSRIKYNKLYSGLLGAKETNEIFDHRRKWFHRLSFGGEIIAKRAFSDCDR